MVEVNKHDGKQKKSIAYVCMTSTKQKNEFIDTLNSEIGQYAKDNDQIASLIPTTPLPSITFWFNEVELTTGFTITRQNSKFGWRYNFYNKKWEACSYMSGMQCSTVEFSPEIHQYLNSILIDCGQKYKLIISKIQ